MQGELEAPLFVWKEGNRGRLAGDGAFAEDDATLPMPVFVESDQLPGNGGREMAEDRLVGRMDVEGGSDEAEERVVGREAGLLPGGKVAAVGDRTGSMQAADAGPVIESLERKVKVVVGLDFEDSEAALAGHGEEIEKSAAGRCEREQLGIDRGGGEF